MQVLARHFQFFALGVTVDGEAGLEPVEGGRAAGVTT